MPGLPRTQKAGTRVAGKARLAVLQALGLPPPPGALKETDALLPVGESRAPDEARRLSGRVEDPTHRTTLTCISSRFVVDCSRGSTLPTLSLQEADQT